MRTTRVLVIDPVPHLVSTMKTILSAASDFEFVGGSSHPRDVLPMALETNPDLVLMSFHAPGSEELSAMKALNAMLPATKVIAWSDHEEPAVIAELIAVGAFGYLLKRTTPEELLEGLRWAANGQSVLSRKLTAGVLSELSLLYRAAEQRALDLHTSYLSTVDALAAALETKDDQTGNHARRVRDYAIMLAETFDAAILQSEPLVFGFLLHDVGKIGIPEHILMKPGPLTEEEWEIMRRHPVMGARILGSIEFLQPHAIGVVMGHHERWDGNGYPNRLAGDDIPLGARLFAVADAFDAMTSDRPYRSAMPVDSAVAEIVRNSGSQFDPAIVDCFIQSKKSFLERWSEDVPSLVAN